MEIDEATLCMSDANCFCHRRLPWPVSDHMKYHIVSKFQIIDNRADSRYMCP